MQLILDTYSFQVAEGDISVEELKTLAKEFEILRPIQRTISSFIGKKWEIIAEKLPEYTNPDSLLRFAVSFRTNKHLRG